MKKIFNKKHAGFSRILLPLFCFLISTLAFGQVPPSPLLINCPNPGLGFNNFPATVSIDNQPVSITKTINTAVYSMSPSSSKCGLTIKPGALLFFPGTGKIGGSITFTFSEPVSNVQIALVSQNSLAGNQLTISANHSNTPVTPVLTVFNSSPDACPDVYEVSGNTIHAKPGLTANASMINIGGSYFTSVTLKNTSSTDTRQWIDLRLCNAVRACTIPDNPTLSIYDQPAAGSTNATFVITNYKGTYTYTITPSEGVTQKNRIITAPRKKAYSVKASSGNCSSIESATLMLP